MLTNEASQKSNPATLQTTLNAISSLASAAGPTPSSSPDGPTTSPSGPPVAPANPSPAPAAALAFQTHGISGPTLEILSKSAALQSSLENRLQVRLAVYGSLEYVLTWKRWDMPSGRSVCALMPLKRRTSGSALIGVPTPQSMDAKGYSEALKHKFRHTGHLKHWTHGTALAVHSSTGVSSWPNPMFVEWLMGFPRLWISGHDYTPTAMPSSHKSPRNS